MKIIDKAIALMMLLSLVLLALLFTSCQNEEDDIIDPNDEEVITANSNLAKLIERTTLRDGSKDNILDSTSCVSVVLPVTVVANGLEIIIDSEEDFETLEAIFEELDDDEDILELLFPITVVLSDHAEIVINNEEELEELADECVEFGNDDDIECLDFVYPITLNVFDSVTQVAEVIIVTNDEDFFDFFDDPESTEIVSIEFPIAVLLFDSTQVEINNLKELENIIEDVEDECDEDDDNDFDDDDEIADPTDFVVTLLNGDWAISLFLDDDDETAEFNGFVFTFLSDSTATATNGSTVISGTWSTGSDDGMLEFELNFGNDSPFDELAEDWKVLEFGENIIRLGDDDDDDELLVFERPGSDGVGDPGAITLADTLTVGLWQVAFYEDSGEDETNDYNGFTLNFGRDSTVLATNGADNISGTWLETTDDGLDILILNFNGTAPFDDFNDDWVIVEVTVGRVELREESDDDEPADILVFEKL